MQRSQLYATDISPRLLAQCKEGILPIQHMREYTANYLKAGGKTSFSDYYTAKHESVILSDTAHKFIVIPSASRNQLFGREQEHVPRAAPSE